MSSTVVYSLALTTESAMTDSTAKTYDASEAREHNADSLNDADACRDLPASFFEPETPKQKALSNHYFRIAALYGVTDVGVRVMRRLDRARGKSDFLKSVTAKPFNRERFAANDFAWRDAGHISRVSPVPIEQAIASLARMERDLSPSFV